MTPRHRAPRVPRPAPPAPPPARWLPDADEFRRLHAPGRSVPLLLEVPDPGIDVLDVLEGVAGDRIAYLLETAGGPIDLDRRTFLAWDPEREYVLRRGSLETWVRGICVARRRVRDPLAELRAELRDEGGTPVSYTRGFVGGLVGYLSYDFKNWLERLPDTVHDDLGIPELRLGLVRRVLAWDRRADTLSLCANVRCGADADRDLERARAELLALWNRVASLPRPAVAAPPVAGRVPRALLRSNTSRAAYDSMLARADEHILAGDLYQANLSHRFEAPFAGRGIDLYRRLRAINPSPFAAYLRFPEHEVVSCSPERLVHLENGRVETRPIAGTRPRGPDRAADRRLQRDLLADEKERAEHLMIVDMARNDIGRVCEPGSVQVERFMRVEAYSHVRHLVSNITGVLRADRDAFDLVAATFPGASITGVPKVRCMGIIDALEKVRRGVYTGSAGWIGLDGNLDLNILIRTFLLQDGRAWWHVGGGIVADSDAGREYEETLAKGRALQEALLTTPIRSASRAAAPATRRPPARPARRAAPAARSGD